MPKLSKVSTTNSTISLFSTSAQKLKVRTSMAILSQKIVNAAALDSDSEACLIFTWIWVTQMLEFSTQVANTPTSSCPKTIFCTPKSTMWPAPHHALMDFGILATQTVNIRILIIVCQRSWWEKSLLEISRWVSHGITRTTLSQFTPLHPAIILTLN